MLAEAELLDDLDLVSTPPCDIYPLGFFGDLCDQPSTHRVRLRCPECGVKIRFVCREHYEDILAGIVGSHRSCGREGTFEGMA